MVLEVEEGKTQEGEAALRLAALQLATDVTGKPSTMEPTPDATLNTQHTTRCHKALEAGCGAEEAGPRRAEQLPRLGWEAQSCVTATDVEEQR